MSKIKTSKWYVYDHLKTDEDIVGFLEASIMENDPEYLPHAIETAARAREINATAKKLRVKRESLYKKHEEQPRSRINLETALKIIGELGFNVHLVPDKNRKFARFAVA